MKKPLKYSKVILLAFVAFFGFAGFAKINAQGSSTAKYDKITKVLSLDEKAAFGYLYQLDIASMGFASKEKADEFFSNLTTELVSFQVNFEKRTTSVLLKLRSKPTWNVKEWNNYLAQLPKQ